MSQNKLKSIAKQLLKNIEMQKEMRTKIIELNSKPKNSGRIKIPSEYEDSILSLLSDRDRKLHTHYKEIQRLINSEIDIAISINSILEKPLKKILTIEEIQKKEFITADEFTLLYGYSKQWQTQRRSKLYNALEVVSESNKKVLYNSETVRKWMDNELK